MQLNAVPRKVANTSINHNKTFYLEFITYWLQRTHNLLIPSKAGHPQPSQYPRDPHPQQPPYPHGLGTAEPAKRPAVKVDERLLVLDIPQHRRGAFPAPFFRLGTGPDAHGLSEFVVHESLQAAYVAVGVARLDEEAGVLVSNEVRYASGLASHHGHSRRHALEYHEPERLGVGRHDEAVGRGERAAQLIPAQLAGEHRPRPLEVLLELILLRTRPDEAKSCIGHLLEHRLDVLKSLLGTEPSHVNHQEVVGIAICHPLAPEFLAPELRVESNRVDSLPPDLHAGYTVRLHLLLHLRTRDQREVGPRVHEPQHRPAALLDAGEPTAVVPPVQGEVGVVRKQKWYAHDARVEESGEQHEARTRDVDQVRPPPLHHLRALHLGQIERK